MGLSYLNSELELYLALVRHTPTNTHEGDSVTRSYG